MADENDNQNDNTQQNDQTQQVDQQSTGSESWDKLIDSVADTGKVGEGDGKTQQSGKTAGDQTQQQDDKTQQRTQQRTTQQQNTDTGQRRQGDGQDQDVQQVRSPARKYGDLFRADNKGDIYDANGSLVARQGAQRMIFHRLYPTIEAQSRELGSLRSRIQNFEEANVLAKKEGLSIDEHGAALQMFVQWKKDPVKMMNTLLTIAEQNGKDVSSIRAGGGLSAADIRTAVQEIVSEQIKPFSFLTEQYQQQQEQQQFHEAVATEYASFIEEFPDAKVHEESIANVMRDHNVPAREAYFMVRTFAAERGLNWKEPLAQQLTQRNPSGGGNNRRQLPSMNGRNRSQDTHVEEGAMDQANASDSWDAIARRTMKKHGIAI